MAISVLLEFSYFVKWSRQREIDISSSHILISWKKSRTSLSLIFDYICGKLDLKIQYRQEIINSNVIVPESQENLKI